MPQDDSSDFTDFLQLLRRDGVVRDASAVMTPLTGGVSSEIYRVQDGDRVFIVKRALSKLRVRDDWFADVGRNRYERLYLQYVSQFLPKAVPSVLAGPTDGGYFVMEYLGPEYLNWKQLMMNGQVQTAHAALAGEVLGAIHRHSAGDEQAKELFDTTPNFHQLRVDPYLLTAGARHPEFRDIFQAEAERLEATRLCLVHGDFSPKNMLIGGDRLVVLDCEVAWYGDPAFDAAFLLNHLFLKSLYHAGKNLPLRQMIDAFWSGYQQACGNAFDRDDLHRRVSRLLLLLMLARVDGKSPAEYLDEPARNFIRDFVSAQLCKPRFDLSAIADAWFLQLKQTGKNR